MPTLHSALNRVRAFTITAAGLRRLETEQKSWQHFAMSMLRVLRTE